MSSQNPSNLPEVKDSDIGARGLLAADTRSVATEWFSGVPRSALGTTLAGYLMLLVGMVSFGAWAARAPIDGAIVAAGVFVATGQNKVIQHLEGGIIRKILVREGEVVDEGQSLVVLDDTAVHAELRRLRLREYQLLAQEARLRTEEQLIDELEFQLDADASELGTDALAILDTQRAIFAARQRKLQNEVAILQQTIATHRSRETGDTARLRSIIEQLQLIDEELGGKKQLVSRGLVRMPEYYAVRRAKSNAVGQVANLKAEISDSQEKIKATEHQIARVRSIYMQTAVEERLTTGAELKDIRERLVSARSVIDRLVVRAPVRGIVVKINYHTSGGVIRPGNDILALLPLGDELIIEARIKPQDIDNLRKEQPASVRLTALSQRITPIVAGRVVYVSADAVPNDARGAGSENVYVARIRLDGGEAEKVPGFLPTPGMPAEVFINTGQRTFLEYLIQPVYDTMARAFRES